MSGLQPPRGTHDLIGETMRRHHHVVETARRVLRTYGFEEWSTPIFEDTRVFSRTLGETSDVVSKEMYTFEDRGGESITLRPEGTAAICRALVTNGLTQSLPQKVFYHGPMFRYERPQKGRYRQFHQIGAELIGAESPLRDAETIAMAQDILRELGLGDHVTLELNTLGDLASRQAWREALVAYFRDHADALSEESRIRLEANPLRILDSKSEQDRKLLDDAPAFADYLNDESRQFWDMLRDSLQAFGVDFIENPRIVRGLDYYSHTAFEFVTSKLGAQGTVLAGGRYEGLVEQMGGPAIPAIGWAGGIERLAMLLDSVPELPAGIALVPMGDVAVLKAASIARALRLAGLRAEIETRGNMKKRMERVVKSGASHAIVLGDEEIAKNIVQLRDLSSREQQEVPVAELVQVLSAGRP
ncbi:histidine--tRNA ligase [Gluconobacter sphaericus]|uniref:Histidine--tRNA ligase n=1 Tax=Gluconobacter sphaericus NBRC 12467 TaxID=1307951 RepID=A0AA37SFR3_9PROT|nr:histidine--tRNA ligase [Gluconobacter sphaericus]MBF0885325.1 histidine--tRNA ligase [Gluconobacter sphaericus]GBR56087.1 histidyl-tRNA synthetase [Gluconobacter sphaericus NBRC 12467]GEB42098.1 histidine--tRNA ligase [Gluconobacter sphaericus NBRC 12467]GLQ84535.1 histidine--tRNA ligase [Gluconobacter sphaericus NBRC 12467]GLQ85311.1 histidine--tRNA ligase [Gluconobacter sphaericus NBRC 12467]